MGRERRLYSVQAELLAKSREAALAGVQIFNNPQIQFKSELFIVTMTIAWTYLLHAHYRSERVEYRYWRMAGTRKRYDRTRGGAIKHWELERCLNEAASPVDRDTSNNLRFLIGIRHEIEHQMTTRIDASLTAKFQACCLNFNHYIKKLFGDKHGIDQHLAFSLQFSALSEEQVTVLSAQENLPGNIVSYINTFEERLTEEEYNSPQFAYRVLFVPKIANRKGQADQVIEFVKADSELAKELGDTYKSYTVIKETERPKYLPKNIVSRMKDEGYAWFTQHKHTELWHAEDAKNPAHGFGVQIASTWYWYEPWLTFVREHCGKQEQ